MMRRQAHHWEMTYFCVCIDRNEKFDVDWSEFLSTATDSSNLCVTGELVRTPQSKVATFGKDTAVRSLCQSPGIESCKWNTPWVSLMCFWQVDGECISQKLCNLFVTR